MKVEIKGGGHIIVESVESADGQFESFTIRLAPRLEKLLDQLQEDGIESLRGPPGPAGRDGAQGPPGLVGTIERNTGKFDTRPPEIGVVARHTGENQP